MDKVLCDNIVGASLRWLVGIRVVNRCLAYRIETIFAALFSRGGCGDELFNRVEKRELAGRVGCFENRHGGRRKRESRKS